MKTLLSIVFFFIAINCFSQKLVLKVTNIDIRKGGYLKIAMFNNEDTFLKTNTAFRKYHGDIKTEIHKVLFDSIPSGNYAISVFHDENSNHELDANFLFIPTEGYGFSNNPKFYGPSNWEKTHFNFNGGNKEIEIKIDY